MVTFLSASDIGKLIQPGMLVYVQGSIGQPTSLLQGLDGVLQECAGLHFVSVLTPGLNGFPVGKIATDTKLTTFFDYKELRKSLSPGDIEFVPSHYSDIPKRLKEMPQFDLALIQLSRPDGEGACSTGLSADFVPDILSRCNTVVGELNSQMPRLRDAPSIPLDRLDYAVMADYQLVQTGIVTTNPTLERIAEHATELIRDGDTLQFGVGRIPPVVLSKLTNKNDLGLHTGLVTPAVRPLIERGVMNGALKTIDTGKHVAGAAVGDDAFYAWLRGQPAFSIRPVSYTHSAQTLATIDNFVAINSAIEVDLFGQANSEMANGRQVSGSGGLVDFIRGARLSRGGRAIICLQAAGDKGGRSNIVLKLTSVVSVCRTDLDYVVTEYGIAALAGKSVAEKASALIAIAAPQFRDRLQVEWNVLQA
tara:strand:+ start:2856 stop:4118 length:1263 start_codon:yes stop_codon:yes gene_type:complete